MPLRCWGRRKHDQQQQGGEAGEVGGVVDGTPRGNAGGVGASFYEPGKGSGSDDDDDDVAQGAQGSREKPEDGGLRLRGSVGTNRDDSVRDARSAGDGGENEVGDGDVDQILPVDGARTSRERVGVREV